MALTRKHFKALAKILHDHRADISNEEENQVNRTYVWASLYCDMVDFCQSENSNFDADRFRAAVEDTV